MNKKTNKYLIDLGKQIKQARINKGFSQEGLALAAEIDRSYYGGIERGERNVSFTTLLKIASALDCDISKFTIGIP